MSTIREVISKHDRRTTKQKQKSECEQECEWFDFHAISSLIPVTTKHHKYTMKA